MAFAKSISIMSPILLLSAFSACSEAPGEKKTITTREVDVAGLVRAREETVTTEPVRPDQQDDVESGQLTAGDYDDNLNPDLYADYVRKTAAYQQDGFPVIDARRRVTVKVLDIDGTPVPHARLTVSRKGGPLRLVTTADGTASFYPAFDGIRDGARVSLTSGATGVGHPVRLSGASRQLITLTAPAPAQAVHALDLLLVLDATGSMGDEMAYLQTELEAIIGRLKQQSGNVDIRLGLIVYRDDGDDFVVRSFPLTADMATLRSALVDQEAQGGGDTPEAVDRALLAATRMQWRPDAAKALLLVADAPPHPQAVPATLEAAAKLRREGVQIVPVAASGVEDSAQYLMRAVALLTQGRYIFLTDDSGIGNPHAEPDAACYVVTRLDHAIGRVLTGIVEGRRIEPVQAEVIRTVGDYDKGRCRGVQVAAQ